MKNLKELFHKATVVAAVCSFAALGGCAGFTSATLQNDVANIEAQVQADANVLCGFVPTAATIAAFIPGFGSVAASAATIATGICAAIAKAPVVSPAAARMAASGADVQVAVAKLPNGTVPIVGHYTR